MHCSHTLAQHQKALLNTPLLPELAMIVSVLWKRGVVSPLIQNNQQIQPKVLPKNYYSDTVIMGATEKSKGWGQRHWNGQTFLWLKPLLNMCSSVPAAEKED